MAEAEIWSTYTQSGAVESMKNGDGDISIAELNHTPEGGIVQAALLRQRKHLALGFQKGVNDGLNVDSAHVVALAKGNDVDLAIEQSFVVLSRATNLKIHQRQLHKNQI